jgi:hypothetical protein
LNRPRLLPGSRWHMPRKRVYGEVGDQRRCVATGGSVKLAVVT